jgi:hypothetical protein
MGAASSQLLLAAPTDRARAETDFGAQHRQPQIGMPIVTAFEKSRRQISLGRS